ncbi:hypothetical protein CRE_12961 [Caenorhabditis remanei]|uniref:G-protein coupled receptors family 1 profile domain-containing protein n=1 Tax=Caenorhabditis remanei TaxID=31234 RepID=E3N101_CAERE|nr:hypothetical protein CRE_12961 [Caenorhabditis remanei]
MSRFNTKTSTTTTTTEAYKVYEPEFFEMEPFIAEYNVRLATLGDMVFSIFGIFLNLFHFTILTQKPLRSQFVFQILIIICLSDIILFSGSILWGSLDPLVGSLCTQSRPYSHHIWRIIIMSLQYTVKNVSFLLVLLLPALGIFSLSFKFPIKVFFVFGLAGLCTAWQVWYHTRFPIVKVKPCRTPPKTTFESYKLEIDYEFFYSQKFISDCMKCVRVSFYIISIVIQFLKLKKVIQKKSWKDDQIILVLIITLSFFISESIDICVLFFDRVYLKPYMLIQSLPARSPSHRPNPDARIRYPVLAVACYFRSALMVAL